RKGEEHFGHGLTRIWPRRKAFLGARVQTGRNAGVAPVLIRVIRANPWQKAPAPDLPEESSALSALSALSAFPSYPCKSAPIRVNPWQKRPSLHRRPTAQIRGKKELPHALHAATSPALGRVRVAGLCRAGSGADEVSGEI